MSIALGFAVLLVLAGLTVLQISHHGMESLYRGGDSNFYRDVARAPFGNGSAIQIPGSPGEASYRYGRILLPAVSWISAGGDRGAVTWTLVGWNLVAIAGCVSAAGVLLADRGADPRFALAVFASPGLLVLTDKVYAEPLAILCILLGYVLHARQRTKASAVAFAAALLVRETAVLALLPLVWRAWRRRDLRELRLWCAACLPATVWFLLVWWRVGQLPFLATTTNRTSALSAPLVALARFAMTATSPARVPVTLSVGLTAVAAFVVWRRVRWFPVASSAMVFGFFALCIGSNSLRFAAEAQRLLAPAQVLTIVALVAKVTHRETPGHSV